MGQPATRVLPIFSTGGGNYVASGKPWNGNAVNIDLGNAMRVNGFSPDNRVAAPHLNYHLGSIGVWLQHMVFDQAGSWKQIEDYASTNPAFCFTYLPDTGEIFMGSHVAFPMAISSGSSCVYWEAQTLGGTLPVGGTFVAAHNGSNMVMCVVGGSTAGTGGCYSKTYTGGSWSAGGYIQSRAVNLTTGKIAASLAYDSTNSVWVFAGHRQVAALNDRAVIYSTIDNGVNWVQQQVTTGLSTVDTVRMAHNGAGLSVGICSDSTTPATGSDAFYSSDGLAWSEEGQWVTDKSAVDIHYNSKAGLFMVVCNDGATYHTFNGVDFVEKTEITTLTVDDYVGISTDGMLWLALLGVDIGGTTVYTLFASADDGSSWEDMGALWDPSVSPTLDMTYSAFGFHKDVWLCGVDDDASNLKLLRTSIRPQLLDDLT